MSSQRNPQLAGRSPSDRDADQRPVDGLAGDLGELIGLLDRDRPRDLGVDARDESSRSSSANGLS